MTAKIYQFKSRPVRFFSIKQDSNTGIHYLMEHDHTEVHDTWELKPAVLDYISELEMSLYELEEKLDYMESHWKKPEPINIDTLLDNMKYYFAQKDLFYEEEKEESA